MIDYIVARALKKKADERYASAAEFAKDLREAAREVAAAEGVSLERAQAKTVPNPSQEKPPEASTSPLAREEPLELRPSPRFDSSEGLAKLGVLPADSEATSSRSGWTVSAKRPSRKLDAARAAIIVAYLVAFLVAIAIVLL